MAGFPIRDGSGPIPDSWQEVLFDVFLVVVVGAVFVFTGADAQVEYAVTAPGDYLLSSTSSSEGVKFSTDDLSLLNEVNSRSLGSDAVASERLYCAELRNGAVTNLRLADRIDSSSLTSVAGGCLGTVDLWLHTQPDGSDQLSEEDKSLESTGASVTCIQYSEMTASPVTGKVGGVNCWEIVDKGDSFDPISVLVN